LAGNDGRLLDADRRAMVGQVRGGHMSETSHEEATHVASIELFFDLVFVFVITQFTLLVEEAHRLRDLQGQFILSIDDVPEIRKAFAGFDMQEADLHYSVAGGKGRPAEELIVFGVARPPG
jgi:hypothetical protein